MYDVVVPTLWKNALERVFGAVMRHQNPCSVVQKVVEVEHVHGIFQQRGGQGLQRSGYQDRHGFGVVVALIMSCI